MYNKISKRYLISVVIVVGIFLIYMFNLHINNTSKYGEEYYVVSSLIALSLVFFVLYKIVIRRSIFLKNEKINLIQEVRERRIMKYENEIIYYNEIISSELSIENIVYIGGYKSLPNKIKRTTLILTKDALKLYCLMKKVLYFSIPATSIIDVEYDLSENITISKALSFGIDSFALKKKTYYLIITYLSEENTENTVVFETGRRKNQMLSIY